MWLISYLFIIMSGTSQPSTTNLVSLYTYTIICAVLRRQNAWMKSVESMAPRRAKMKGLNM